MNFQRLYRTKIFIATVLAAVLVSPTLTYASSLADKHRQLNDVKSRIESNRSSQSAAEKQQAEILQEIQLNDQKIAQLQGELNRLQAELDKVVEQRHSTERKLQQTQQELEATINELEEVKRKLAQRRDMYNLRIISAYKNGGSRVLSIVLSAKNFSDFEKRLALLGAIAADDARLIKGMKELSTVITTKITEIEISKRAIEEQRSRLIQEERRVAELRSKVIEKQGLISEEQRRQKALLEEARQKEIELAKAEEMLKATSDSLVSEIRELERVELERRKAEERRRAEEQRKAAEKKISESASKDDGGAVQSAPTPSEPDNGQFHRPVPGPITSGFGYRFHPVLKYSRLHAGVDFRAPTGTPVRAAQSGTVLIAGWKGGYGNTVVISHGNGLTTLYGHNSRLAVKAGQYVSRGQIIAYAGSTGLSTGPHLHFEVRVNGEPKNPTNWL